VRGVVRRVGLVRWVRGRVVRGRVPSGESRVRTGPTRCLVRRQPLGLEDSRQRQIPALVDPLTCFASACPSVSGATAPRSAASGRPTIRAGSGRPSSRPSPEASGAVRPLSSGPVRPSRAGRRRSCPTCAASGAVPARRSCRAVRSSVRPRPRRRRPSSPATSPSVAARVASRPALSPAPARAPALTNAVASTPSATAGPCIGVGRPGNDEYVAHGRAALRRRQRVNRATVPHTRWRPSLRPHVRVLAEQPRRLRLPHIPRRVPSRYRLRHCSGQLHERGTDDVDGVAHGRPQP
jgi:hypothetical protein